MLPHLRGRVAAPLDWDEIGSDFDPRRYSVRTIGGRLEGREPWAGMRKRARSLTAAGRRLARVAGGK